MKTDWSNYTITYDGTDYGVYYRDGINLVACETYVPNSPTPTYPATITNTVDLVTADDSDWNTPIVYGEGEWVGDKPSELGVGCYKIPLSVSGANLLDVNKMNTSGTIGDMTPGAVWATPVGEGSYMMRGRVVTAASNSYTVQLLKPNTKYYAKATIKKVASQNPGYDTPLTKNKVLLLYSGKTGYPTIQMLLSAADLDIDEEVSISQSFTTPPGLHEAEAAYFIAAYSERWENSEGNFDDATIIFKNLIISEVDTGYEPYHKPNNYNIYLSSPLRYGDTLSLDGTLIRSRAVETAITGETYSPTGAKADGEYLCTQDTGGNMTAGEITFTQAVTNATVEYELAEPITESIAMPQSVPTFAGTTIIRIESAVQPSVMEAEYWATEE